LFAIPLFIFISANLCSLFDSHKLKYALAYHGSKAMRLISVLLLSCLAGGAHAADTSAADLQPLPPPPAFDQNPGDGDLEPQVTITKKTDMVIEEYRVGGKLFKIKVIPKIGKPYFLIDERGDGQFSRQDGPDASNLRPPQWVIHEF
jgi:Protein of unknown function (DUF2782)